MIEFVWGMAVGAFFTIFAGAASGYENDNKWFRGALVAFVILAFIAIGFSMAASVSNGTWQIVVSTPTPGLGR